MNKLVQIIKKNEKLYKITKKIYSEFYYLIQDKHKLCINYHRLISVLVEKKRVDMYRMQALKGYCIKNNIGLKILEPSQSREVYVPKYYENCNDFKILKFQSPEVYTTKLTDVFLVGGCSFMLKGKCILYDMFEIDKDNRFDLRFGSIVSISNKGEVAVKSYSAQAKPIEKGIFLIGFGSYNYYHLTIELLSKFKYIDALDELDDYPLIIDEIVIATPQFQALLDLLNSKDRKIIPLKKNTKYEVCELVYISDISWMPINVKDNLGLIDEDCRISIECIKYLRSQVMKNYDISFSSAPNGKYFLSRKSMYVQRLSNELEVASLFKRYGFKVIYPEDLSLKEQVELFASASIVVGTTGAALTNIIYCPFGTTFISIIPKKYNFNIYSTIAYNLGLNSLYLDAKIINWKRKISDSIFELDLDYCERFLKDISIGSDDFD